MNTSIGIQSFFLVVNLQFSQLDLTLMIDKLLIYLDLAHTHDYYIPQDH
jgi:hypothetical protein